MFSLQYNLMLPTEECTKEAFYKIVGSEQVRKRIADFRQLKAEGNNKEADTKKRSLPLFIYQATFEKSASKNGEDARWRKQAHARLNGLVMLDIDHIDDPVEVFRQKMPSHWFDEGATNQVMLVHVTPSGKGLRIVFKASPQVGDLSANQHWLATQMGLTLDEACKDASRASFAPQQKDLLFINDGIFTYQDEEYEKVFGNKYRGYPQPSHSGDIGSLTFKGIPYHAIIDEWWRRTGGEPTEGERNVKLHRLAANLRAICDNKRETLLAVMPRCGLSELELASIVDSACKESPRGFSRQIQGIIRDLQKSDDDSPSGEEESGLPPSMPSKLPPLIKLLVSKEPEIYHPTIANAVFPALGIHFTDVNFPYVDNTLHEATFMCCTMAPMASGKSCVNRLVDRILDDIRKRDMTAIDRENEWKQQCKTRGANKEKPRRPEGLCVQILESDMTNAAFVQKLVDAAGKYLYVIVDEVELFHQLQTNGNRSVGKLFRLAFDNKPYGQVRVGTDSVSGSMPLRWNWNALTTIQRGKTFFRKMKADGTLSRINFTTILTERGQDIPVHGIYDEKFDEQLKPYIDRLNAANGTIDCPQAHKLVRKMLKENRRIAELGDDELYERLSYRAVVIAWLKAMTLYVAEGKWSKQIEEFAIWSMRYDMWCKMNFFGEDMREQMSGEVIHKKPGPRNLLDQLPDEFSQADAEQMRARNGKGRNATNMLYMWKQRKYIKVNPDTHLYQKIK